MEREQVIAMRERYATGEKAKPIASDYGISIPQVYRICQGICYSEYGGPISPRRGRRGNALSMADLIEAIRLRNRGWTYGKIGRELDVTGSYVHAIFLGKNLVERFERAKELLNREEVDDV